MKRLMTAVAALALMAAPVGSAFAQPGHDDHRNDNHQADNHHPDNHPGPGMAMHGPAMHGPAMAMHGPVHHDWHNGGRIEHADWNRGARVDWNRHHLRRPPRGYEWRQVDGNYVLAAAATGLIASVILANQ